jgi:hypothetical protein
MIDEILKEVADLYAWARPERVRFLGFQPIYFHPPSKLSGLSLNCSCFFLDRSASASVPNGW